MSFRMPILNSIQTEKCKSIMFFHVQTNNRMGFGVPIPNLHARYMSELCESSYAILTSWKPDNRMSNPDSSITNKIVNIEINNQPHFCVHLCSFCPAAWLLFDFFQSSGERVKTKLEVKPTTLLPILCRVSIFISPVDAASDHIVHLPSPTISIRQYVESTPFWARTTTPWPLVSLVIRNPPSMAGG